LKIEKMEKISYVVVFPSIFSKNKIPQLIKNIKKILKIKNQKYNSVKRDGDIILVMQMILYLHHQLSIYFLVLKKLLLQDK